MFCGVARRKNQNIEKFREGDSYERKKQRAERKQEGGTENPQREKKGEEGKEEMVGCAIRGRAGLSRQEGEDPLTGLTSS